MSDVEKKQVTVRELTRNTAEVVARVAKGEQIEITRNGELVATMGPPDQAEVAMRGLVKAGLYAPDWQQRQTSLLSRLQSRPPRPTPEGRRPASEVLIEMREEGNS
jgi:antitoxin (DNA-binding transcriptional repressor) of toxin-antitoxin stability system